MGIMSTAGVAMATAANAPAQATLLGIPPYTAVDGYGTGTAYSLTTSSAAVAFGTTSPTITLATAATYWLTARVNLKYNGATFAAIRNVTIKIRRTNNTAADVASATTSVTTGVVSALTQTMMQLSIPDVSYTAGAGDILSIFAIIDVAPTLGSLDIVEAELHARRVS